jgi:hypothetical protein
MIPMQYPASSYEQQERYNAAALYARHPTRPNNVVWREAWIPSPPLPPPSSLCGMRPYHYPSFAASRLALEQETRELLHAEFRARELSHLQQAAVSRYRPPPPRSTEVPMTVQALPTLPAAASPIPASVPRTRKVVVPPRPRHPPKGAALIHVVPVMTVEAEATQNDSKKSEDELAAATVLAALLCGKHTKLASTSQVVNRGRKRGTPSSLPPKKLHKLKKFNSLKHSTKKKQRGARLLATQAAVVYDESPKPMALPSAIVTNMYCLPTTNDFPPVIAPGHVSDENSSMDDACSSDEGSRTHSPILSSSCADSVIADPEVLNGTKWSKGVVSLSLSEDDDVLSPLHCFMRRYCVEAFSASTEDVATPRYGKSHGFKVEVGQVGIRCLYCKHQPVGNRPDRAVCYPSSLRNIYHSIETWQRRHSLVCTHITPWVRKSIVELMESSKTRAGGRRQYWEDSARRIGMVDTARGVRFYRPPGDEGPTGPSLAPHYIVTGNGPTKDTISSVTNLHAKPVVQEDDKDLVTDYLFLLMDQMQTCRFTEEDRTGGRSKIKDNHVGFPGMECRHCLGRAGFGRYFPSSVSALSLANSDRNVFNHLQKCRRCPSQIKSELVRLSKDQSQCKNRRGLRKLFFNRIWNRIHDGDDDSTMTTPTSPSE